jgi:hypothetical protein
MQRLCDAGSNGGGGGGGGGASSSSLKKSSVAGANIGSGKVLRDKPWNPKPKVKSEAFSIGAGGKMEVCFMTSAGNNTNNRQKPKKKADKVHCSSRSSISRPHSFFCVVSYFSLPNLSLSLFFF